MIGVGKDGIAPPLSSAEEESGAVAVLVAISLVVLLGVAAFAIGLGSAWSTKRDLVIDLDSASLAGARTLAEGLNLSPDSCPAGGSPQPLLQAQIQTAAEQMFAANGGDANLLAVEVDCSRQAVTVRGDQEAVTALAPVLGVNELVPGGYSISRTLVGEGGNVLPITLCLFGDEIQGFLPGQPLGYTVWLQYGNAGFECGDDPANYGWWPANDASSLRGFIDNGLPVTPTLPPSISCDTTGVASPSPGVTQDGYCIGGPGNKSNLLPRINQVYGCGDDDRLLCPQVTFLIHDESYCDSPGGSCGQRAEYRPYAFLDAVVRGQTGNGANSRLRLEFIRIRTGPETQIFKPSSSFMCSADGAPEGDPNCG